MKKAHPLLLGFVILIFALSPFYIVSWQSGDSATSDQEQRERDSLASQQSESEIGSESENPAAPGSESLEDDPPAETQIERWSERYPSAVVFDERFVETGAKRVRRQRLLLTGDESFPAVIWEDKLRQDASGEWLMGGSTAYMGNVFLAQTSADKVDPDELSRFIDAHDLFVERTWHLSGYMSLGIDEPALGKLESLMAAYQARFPSAIVELEIISFPSATPSDWKRDREWGLDQIQALDAWDTSTGSSEVVVAVIDTGLERGHPDIAPNLFVNPGEISGNGVDDDENGLIDDVSGWDFFSEDGGDNDPGDSGGHGTHVAGIIAAAGDNGIGTVGVAWNVKLLPLKVGNTGGLRTGAINEALSYVAELQSREAPNAVNIVATNNSYGSGSSDSASRNAIEHHRDLGILFVAAAGNDGYDMDGDVDLLQYPAAYPFDNILSVANSNQEQTLTPSSNRGSTSVDLSAPGEEIFSTYLSDGYSYLSGTSMSSPMVAGTIAVLASAEPSLSSQELRKRILDTVDKVPSQQGLSVTGGRLNLLSALKPDLVGHSIEVTNFQDSLIILASEETAVRFETAALATAAVGAEIIEGAGIGELRETGAGVFEFTPIAPGLARIRFTAELQDVLRQVEKTVVVKDVADVTAGLLHHYGFEGSGATEVDLAGNADGTVWNAQRLETEFGKGIRFNDATSEMQFDGEYTEQVTIATLVKSEDLFASGHPRLVNMPFYYLYLSSGSGSGVPDGNRHTLKFLAERNPSAGIWNSPPRSIQDDTWLYLVATYDSSDVDNEPALYINGELQVARRQQDPQGVPFIPSGPSYLANNGDGNRSFEGLMASVRIYDRALSASEVGALGATLALEKWDRYGIVGPEEALIDEVAEFATEDYSDLGSELAVDWTVQSEGAYEIVSEANDRVGIRFLDETSYQLQAQMSDGVSTLILSRSVQATVEKVNPGIYTGGVDGGGTVWVEVDPSLTSGRISVFATEDGFYRIDEEIAIEASGAFSTAENSAGRIFGSVLGSLVGEVAGYDVTFTGDQTMPSSEVSEFAGRYIGGVLGSPGDRLELTVWDDGRCMLWRLGPLADLSLGNVETDGSFSLVSARGEDVIGSIDLDASQVRGTVGLAPFFQKLEGEASSSELYGGVIAGALAGQGAAGLYGNFVEAGETAAPRLAGGTFGRGATGAEDSRFIAIQADGRTLVGDRFGEAGPVGSMDAAIAGGDLDLRQKPLEAIQAQIVVNEAGGTLVGFAIVGEEPKEVLLRGLGPSFSEANTVDPSLVLHRLEGDGLQPLAANLNWSDETRFTGIGESAQGAFRALEAVFQELGLGPLPIGSLDAAMRIWLEPGTYVLQAKAETSEAGASFIEVFELP